MKKIEFIHIVLFAFVAVFFRFIFLILVIDQPLNIVDEQHYQALARTLLDQGSYLGESGQPTAMRPPLYPAFLALLYAVWGSVDPNVVRVAQTVLALLTGLVLWRLGARLWGERAGLAGGVIYLFYPTLLFFNGLLLSETLFILLFTLFLFHCERYLRNGGWADMAAAGVSLAAAALTRGLAYHLALPLALLLLWQKRADLRSALVGVLVFLVCFWAVLTPWSVRNYQVFGVFAPVGTMGGINLSMGNYAHTPLHRSWAAVEVSGAQGWGQVYRNELVGLNEGERQARAMALAKEYMVDHPGQTLLRSLIKLANFWGLERTIIAGVQQGIFPGLSNPLLIVVLIPLIVIPYLLVALFGVFGLLWRVLYDRQGFDLVFALLLIGMTGMHALTFGHPRYHLPLIPILCGYAAWSSINFKPLRAVYRKKVLAVALSVLAFFGLVWSYDVLIGSQDKLSALLQLFFN